jgi:hypothetical protein
MWQIIEGVVVMTYATGIYLKGMRKLKKINPPEKQ